jgi:hypothetical protein
MQHGMHNAMELLQVENKLLDRELKYHYLVAEERARHPRPAVMSKLLENLRAFFAQRPLITQEQGI